MLKQTIRQIMACDCTGCGACNNICPTNAITMEYSEEGFLYPKITGDCVNCGKCLEVCSVNNPAQHNPVPETYAVWAKDDIRKQSSSGGMFTLMAQYVLMNKGAVCGAVYSEDFRTVYHDWAETEAELKPLRGSKYVQSDTRLSYRQAKTNLDFGRMVLYTGCPCQIAGLYRYLGKDYKNLFTADLICHGAKSVPAYQSFINEFSGGKEIEKVDFRDKKHYDWSTPTVVYLKDGTVKKAAWNESTWNKGFLEGVINRMCCYNCPYARPERIADVTLGDCWQVHRYNSSYDDRIGTSMVLVNTDNGRKLFEKVRRQMILCERVPLAEMRKYNGQLNKPATMHPSRRFFFSHLKEKGYHKALWYGRGMRFDVGMVGWWFASNYGSSLTYYALGTVLEEMGKQVLMIPIAKADGNPWEKEIEQTVGFLGRYFHIGKEREYDKMAEFNNFCDSFMLGSDQMWTASTISLVGYTFFLDFVDKDRKKIAFSTSFGHSDFNASDEVCSTASDFLKRFTAISVREKSGVDISRNRFGIEAQQVFDPVFLCPREKYDVLTASVKDVLPEKKYLLCYILDPSPEKETAARSIAEHESLDIITILGMKEYSHAINNWHTGKILPKVTSEQLLFYVKNCDFLLTDSHHGTCFGIIYQKQYAAVANASRGKTRFTTVAEALQLTDRVFDLAEDIAISKSIYQPINYDKVNKLLEKENEQAYNWLKEALNRPAVHANVTARTTAVAMERRMRGEENRRIRKERELAQKKDEAAIKDVLKLVREQQRQINLMNEVLTAKDQQLEESINEHTRAINELNENLKRRFGSTLCRRIIVRTMNLFRKGKPLSDTMGSGTSIEIKAAAPSPKAVVSISSPVARKRHGEPKRSGGPASSSQSKLPSSD